MRAITGVVLGVGVLILQGCPSAYQGAYNKETQRLEAEQRAAQARAAAAHSEARRYASVVYFAVGSAVIGDDGQRDLRWFVEKMQPYPEAVIPHSCSQQLASQKSYRTKAAPFARQGSLNPAALTENWDTSSAPATCCHNTARRSSHSRPSASCEWGGGNGEWGMGRHGGSRHDGYRGGAEGGGFEELTTGNGVRRHGGLA